MTGFIGHIVSLAVFSDSSVDTLSSYHIFIFSLHLLPTSLSTCSHTAIPPQDFAIKKSPRIISTLTMAEVTAAAGSTEQLSPIRKPPIVCAALASHSLAPPHPYIDNRAPNARAGQCTSPGDGEIQREARDVSPGRRLDR